MGDTLRIATSATGAAGDLEPALVIPADDGSRIAAAARELLALYPEARAVLVERSEGNTTAAS